MKRALQVNWRYIPAAKNSLAALSAACSLEGIRLEVVKKPAADITCWSINSINAGKYRDEIRDADCITIVGGPHASACWREVCSYADYVVVGEGERTLPALIRSIEAGAGVLPPGVASQGELEVPRYCTWLAAYPPFSDRRGYIEISRGCPFSCAYCQTPSLFGRQMRHRPIDQIARYARQYEDVRFVTPNALAYGSDGRQMRLDKVEKLLSALHTRPYFGTFPSEVRPEFVTGESLELISSFCANNRLHFGAQSGSDAVLFRLGRGHTVADVIRAVECCIDLGLEPLVDVIVGFPFETDEDQEKTLELTRWIAARGRVHAHYFMSLPGTPLAATTPRDILPAVRREFGKLALDGRLTGSWDPPRIRFFRHSQNVYT
jgi:B12-binding domain/radical SAM domain protein